MIDAMKSDGTSTVRASGRSARLVATSIVAALILSGCSAAARVARVAEPRSTPLLPSINPYDPSQDPVVTVVDRVAPSVVNVTTRTQSRDAIFGGDGGEGVGTGFIIRSDGIIVTNFHVVEGATSIMVTLPPPDSRNFEARVIGGDSDHDLAVLKVDEQDLPTVPLGDSDSVALGERVVALGYALALPGGPSVTSGIISSLARTVQIQDPGGGQDGQGIVRTLEDVLQTDAPINPGNSGGPLVDLAGNVVGINTAGAGEAENIGFAIDINAARPFIERAIDDPEAPAAYLGVTTTTVDAGVAAQFGLPVDRGAYVIDVAPGGPAQGAGIEPGDVIVAFDGESIRGSEQLGELILAREPDDEVEIELVNDARGRFAVSVTLGTRPLPTTG
ncbi:trypsin-like peptidase domain-containing protein [soil metagenome]